MKLSFDNVFVISFSKNIIRLSYVLIHIIHLSRSLIDLSFPFPPNSMRAITHQFPLAGATVVDFSALFLLCRADILHGSFVFHLGY